MLKYRVHISTTLDKELARKLKELHDRTRIPTSKLMDEAVTLLIQEHKKHQD